MYHSAWPCQLANFITAQPRMNSTYWHLSVCNRIVSIQHYGEMVFVLFPNNYNLVGTSHSLIYILVKFWLVCICNSIVFLFRFTLLRCRALSLQRRRDRQISSVPATEETQTADWLWCELWNLLLFTQNSLYLPIFKTWLKAYLLS